MEARQVWWTAAVEATLWRLEAASASFFALVTAGQAHRAGLSDQVLSKLVASRRWVRLELGVFAVTALDGGPLQRCAAALLAAPDGAFLHFASAALAYEGLDLDPTTEPRLAVPRTASGRVWPRRSVPSERIAVVQQLRSASPLQTLLDLALELGEERWEWALEAALRRRLVTIAELEAAIAAPGQRRAAVKVISSVLRVRPAGAPPTGSLLETRFIQLCRGLGLPDPVRQFNVRTPGGANYFIDTCWPEIGFFVELDGQQHKDQPVYDAHRHMMILNLTGFMGVVLTWDKVVHRPKTTGRDLLLSFAQAERRRPAS
jgi:hypothetical protein